MQTNTFTSARRGRATETAIYAALGLLLVAVWVIGMARMRSSAGLSPFDMKSMLSIARRFVPLLILFAVNNWVLIPRILFRNRYVMYFGSLLLLLLAVWAWQYTIFIDYEGHHRPHPAPGPGPAVRPLMPLPLFLDCLYGVLTVGCNLAIALLFQNFNDRLERQSLMKESAESQLAYLKAQINPHFYMNMLNNIHALVEIDPARAQDMIIELSHLMRYMLYESARPTIALGAETEFLHNYLRLMRQRYPADKVAIEVSLPARDETSSIMVPPLLFLVFVENAFKHGVSYRSASEVDVSLAVSDGEVVFVCRNTVHPSDVATPPGIGLSNVERRLRLLYADRYTLKIESDDHTYRVTLKIPVNETSDSDN